MFSSPVQTEFAQLLDSETAFQTYLDSVRERRERFIAQSHERNRIQSALDLLTEEHRLTCEAGYLSLAEELKAVIARFAERLQHLENAVAFAPGSETVEVEMESLAVVTARLPETETTVLEPISLTIETLEFPEIEAVLSTVSEPPQIVAEQEPVPALVLLETPQTQAEIPEEPTLDPERLALIAGYETEIKTLEIELKGWIESGIKRPDGQLRRATALEIRRILCLTEAVREEAYDRGVEEEISEFLDSLQNIYTRGMLLVNPRDMNYAPIPESSLNEIEPLSAADWIWLAEGYGWTVEAQKAWEWLAANANPLSNDALKPLVERIGAAQQILHRRLKTLEGSDKLQTALFNELRGFADHRDFFIFSMQAEKYDSELIALAQELPDEWKRLQNFAEQEARAKEKAAKREDCINAVQRALTSEDFGKELTAALACCFKAGVPQTNLQIRNLLVERGASPEDLIAFPKLKESVAKEQERRDTKRGKPEKETCEDDPIDAETEGFLRVLLPDVRGMKVAILGGVGRPRICEQLKSLLELSECRWLPVEKGKNAQRHRPEIEKADFVFLLKNLCSHEMVEKGKEWARAAGKHPVYVPAGFGAKQLVYHLYRLLHAEG